MTLLSDFDEITDVDLDDAVFGMAIDMGSSIQLEKRILAINALGIKTMKDSVRVATTANITLSGEQTIDGISTSTDRILVKNQSTGSENGIYVSAAGAWTRAKDFDTDRKATSGALITVQEGTAKADTLWQLTTNEPITIGTTALVFTEFVGGGGGTLTLDFKATPAPPEGTTAIPDALAYGTLGGTVTGHKYPDGATEDTVTFKVNVPSTLAGTPNAKIVLRVATINATATNETRWEVKSRAISDGESINTAPLTDTAGTDLTMSGTASIEEELVINMNTTPTAGDHLFILVKRLSNHTNDNYLDEVFLTDVSLRIDVQ